MSVICFVQYLKSACEACSVYECPAIFLFKQFMTVSVEAAMKAQATLAGSTNVFYEGALKSYCPIVGLRLKRYVTSGSIAELDAVVHNLRQVLMVLAVYAKGLWKRTLV